METIVLYGCPDECEPVKQYLKKYKMQCFPEQEKLIPALMESRPAAVWVMREGAAGMEGVFAVRRIYPDLPIIWFSNDSGFAPQAYRLHVDFFALIPVNENKVSMALKKCGITRCGETVCN